MYNEFIYFKSIMSHLNMRFVIYFVEQSGNKIFLIDNCAVVCCSVGRAVAFKTRGPSLNPVIRNFLTHLLTTNCAKTMGKKEAGNGTFIKAFESANSRFFHVISMLSIQ